MPNELSDTTPEAHAVWLEMLRSLTPQRKLQMVFDLQETSRMLIMAGLRRRFPDADEEELFRRRADMWLGKELAAEVYGPLPDGWPPTYEGDWSPQDEY